MAGIRFLAEARDLSLLHIIQIGSMANPASYPTGIGTSSLVIK
jgi:hypothetical protein